MEENSEVSRMLDHMTAITQEMGELMYMVNAFRWRMSLFSAVAGILIV